MQGSWQRQTTTARDPALIAQRLGTVRAEIAAAAARAGRSADEVLIVAVTKGQPAATVRAALDAGIEDIGENYVQEARAKIDAVGAAGRWHLIGHLQRNKARVAARLFARVHSVDSEELVRVLGAGARSAGRELPVLVQVKVSEEAAKTGARPEEAEGVCRAVLQEAGLRLEGLMAVPPLVADPEAARPYFRRVRELRDSLARRLGVELPHLSMGMSGDFAVAVEEGATIVRIGRVLFGERPPRVAETPGRGGAPAAREGT